MPQVLTTNATIICPHGGTGQHGAGDSEVADQRRLRGRRRRHRRAQLSVRAVSVHRLSALSSMGLNATEIDGRKVILVTDFNQSLTGLPLRMTEFHQTFDESTPAPIPTGQPAPPPSEEMADLSRPVVVPALQSFPFSISTTPVPVVVTFNLTAAHPLRWMLTLINTTLKRHQDLTGGAPGATVVPANGQWSTPTLTVTVTLTPAFMAALTVRHAPSVSHGDQPARPFRATAKRLSG